MIYTLRIDEPSFLSGDFFEFIADDRLSLPIVAHRAGGELNCITASKTAYIAVKLGKNSYFFGKINVCHRQRHISSHGRLADIDIGHAVNYPSTA